jgi:hypothetical protein
MVCEDIRNVFIQFGQNETAEVNAGSEQSSGSQSATIVAYKYNKTAYTIFGVAVVQSV